MSTNRFIRVKGDIALVLPVLVMLLVYWITHSMCSQMRNAPSVKDRKAKGTVGPMFFRCRWDRISQAFENILARAPAELDPGAPMLLQCI